VTYPDEKKQDSSVGIANRLRAEWSGFDYRQVLGIFLFAIAFRSALWPIQTPIQMVTGVISPGVKRPGRESDHLPPSRAYVKNAWSHIPTPQYAFMEWYLFKHRDNFTLPSSLSWWNL